MQKAYTPKHYGTRPSTYSIFFTEPEPRLRGVTGTGAAAVLLAVQPTCMYIPRVPQQTQSRALNRHRNGREVVVATADTTNTSARAPLGVARLRTLGVVAQNAFKRVHRRRELRAGALLPGSAAP